MNNAIEDDKLIEHITKKSKQNPLDIFELNDGRIIVNGNVFPNRTEFDKILEAARKNIKENNFLNKLFFWKKNK